MPALELGSRLAFCTGLEREVKMPRAVCYVVQLSLVLSCPASCSAARNCSQSSGLLGPQGGVAFVC